MSDIRKEMWDSMADSPYIMIGLETSYGHFEPMTAQLDKDANSAFWIYTKKGNRIEAGGTAVAQYMSKNHDLFACIRGTLVQEIDQTIIEQYWDQHIAAWYSNGLNDPDLLMMRFKLLDAEVWTVEPGLEGKFKLMTGMEVDPDEMGERATLNL
ncbi:MAG: pyridoxamine 5'-phosphate oxidase family protein [Porticoccaceae bacterium]|nr:pyridoxamine 5'-phosphate oxidase family protein [Porticoccaceae bacterium]